MVSLRGHFLLASTSLRDPNFAKSVIFMVKHDEDGAIGVIINAPLEITVSDALADAFPTAPKVDASLYNGGPCKGPMMLLHGEPQVESDDVLPGVRFTADREAIETVMSDPTIAARYVLGYAGWGSDQLEREMAEGSWVVLPATPDEVFADATTDLWQKLMTRANLLKFVAPERIPEDPGLN